MDRNSVIAAAIVVVGTLGAPVAGSAQSYGYADQSSVVVECGAGQRAVRTQRRINGSTQVVARCEGAQGREVVYDEYRPGAPGGVPDPSSCRAALERAIRRARAGANENKDCADDRRIGRDRCGRWRCSQGYEGGAHRRRGRRRSGKHLRSGETPVTQRRIAATETCHAVFDGVFW